MTKKTQERLRKLNNLFLFIFFIIFALQLMGLFILLFITPVRVASAGNVTFTPQVSIPGGTKFDYEKCKKEKCKGKSEEDCKKECAIKFDENNRGLLLAEYIQAWYKFAVAGVGILAVVMIMAGGLIWLTAGGKADQVSTAKDWIMSAVMGLVLALMSYTLLDILNPNLVTFQSLEISDIEDIASEEGCSFKDICTKDEKEIPKNCGFVKEENKGKKCCCSNKGECYSISPALCESYSNCVKMSTSKGDKCAYKEGFNCFIYSSVDSCNNDNNCSWSYVSGYCLEKEVKEGCVGKGTAANGSGCFFNSKCCSGYCDTWGSGLCEDTPS